MKHLTELSREDLREIIFHGTLDRQTLSEQDREDALDELLDRTFNDGIYRGSANCY